jgi:hypothetical protein
MVLSPGQASGGASAGHDVLQHVVAYDTTSIGLKQCPAHHHQLQVVIVHGGSMLYALA